MECDASEARQPRDDLIPNARVKSGGMTEEDWRFVAGPIRQSNFDVIDEYARLRGCASHSYFSLTVLWLVLALG
jgi:hypothetical protein